MVKANKKNAKHTGSACISYSIQKNKPANTEIQFHNRYYTTVGFFTQLTFVPSPPKSSSA